MRRGARRALHVLISLIILNKAQKLSHFGEFLCKLQKNWEQDVALPIILLGELPPVPARMDQKRISV